MKVTTTRFGELDIEESKIIEMPEGMLGFTEKSFILLTPPNLGPFCWFQSIANPDLAFVVVDTKSSFPDYTINLTSDEFEKLALSDGQEVIFLSVVTMAADPYDITVNLQGPIALNPEKMVAKQIVLEGGKYSTRHPFFDRTANGVSTSATKRSSVIEDVSAA